MLQLRNSSGQLDISGITPEDIQSLDENRQRLLLSVIEANKAREAARERYNAAVTAKHAAETEQTAAHAAHKDASDPFPFNPPKIENYPTLAAHSTAVVEARERHDARVREVRGREAHQAAIAAYNDDLEGRN